MSRDVIAYSQRLATVSQSSTVPSFDMTLLIDALRSVILIELSLKSCTVGLGEGGVRWDEAVVGRYDGFWNIFYNKATSYCELTGIENKGSILIWVV